MKASDDFLGSSSGGRRIAYDINETIDESFDVDNMDEQEEIVESPVIEKTVAESQEVYHAKPQYEVNSDDEKENSEDEYEIDECEFSDEDQNNENGLPKSPDLSSDSGLSELSNEQNYF